MTLKVTCIVFTIKYFVVINKSDLKWFKKSFYCLSENGILYVL